MIKILGKSYRTELLVTVTFTGVKFSQCMLSSCVFVQEKREAQYGVVYLSRIENDRVFDPETDGKCVSIMLNKQRTLMNEGINEVNTQKTASPDA